MSQHQDAPQSSSKKVCFQDDKDKTYTIEESVKAILQGSKNIGKYQQSMLRELEKGQNNSQLLKYAQNVFINQIVDESIFFSHIEILNKMINLDDQYSNALIQSFISRVLYKRKYQSTELFGILELLKRSEKFREISKQQKLVEILMRAMSPILNNCGKLDNLLFQLQPQSSQKVDLNQLIIQNQNKLKKFQGFHLNFQDFQKQVAGPQQYSNQDTAGTGIRNQIYRDGGNTHSMRLNQDLDSNNRKKYESQSPLRNFQARQAEENSSGLRKIHPQQQHSGVRQNIHMMQRNQINKYVRAASEPPQQVGVLNSKSIILPVEEVIGENEGDYNKAELQRVDQPDLAEHTDKIITQNDLRGQQGRTQKISMTNSQEVEKGNQRKRSSSSFVMNTFFNQPMHGGQQLGFQNQMSAISSHMSNGTPALENSVNYTNNANYSIISNQNHLAMTRLSRRQLSYGNQGTTSAGGKRESSMLPQKLQVASNQVIAAYGDSRAAKGAQNVSKAEDLRIAEPEQSDLSEESDELSENQDIINEDNPNFPHNNTEDCKSSEAKSPLIPKLNLIQINQDPKKGQLNSIGQQNILTAGAHGVLQTPGMPLISAGPLTSHIPPITSISPEKRAGGDQALLDTSYRTNAIFQNQLMTGPLINSFNVIKSGGPTQDPNSPFEDHSGGSFKQQRNHLLLKLQSTQNNSDVPKDGSNNSFKILEGVASGTLNFGGTQASNVIVQNLPAGGQIRARNQITKMQEIAQQIGESFLAKDLACLISQQRDMELLNDAQLAINNQGTSDDCVKKTKSMFISDDLLDQRKRKSSLKLISTRDDPLEQNQYDNQELVRVLFLNIIDQLLNSYHLEELRLIDFKMPVRIFQNFMMSPYFQTKKQIDSISMLTQDQEQSIETQAIQLSIDGSYSFKINDFENQNDLLFQENQAITRILQKFMFANEDIMRQYIQNNFKNFMDKDKPQLSEIEADEYFKLNRANALVDLKKQEEILCQELGITGDKDHHKYYLDILQHLLGNPNKIWTNGSAYDISSLSTHVPKDVIRRKLDVLLYSISQQIKNTIIKQSGDWNNAFFAQTVTQLVVVLNSYIDGQKQSRVLLNQIIDVSMESLLMIKRVLVDLTLQNHIFIIDQTKSLRSFIQQQLLQKGLMSEQESREVNFVKAGTLSESQSQKGSQYQNEQFLNRNTEIQAQLAVTQLCFRQLFSEFLKLLTQIMKLPQTCDSLKLLNEVFLGNNSWQETVKNFTISMWLQDVIGSTIISFFQKYKDIVHLDELYIIQENLESLRGINVLNFDESQFFINIGYIHNQANIMLSHETPGRQITETVNLKELAEAQLQFFMIQVVNIMNYYKTVPVFLKKAIEIFFPKIHAHQKPKDNNADQRSRNNAGTNLGNSFISRSNTRNIRNMRNMVNTTNLTNDSSKVHSESGPYQVQNNSIYSGRVADIENCFMIKSVNGEQKYWKHAIRRVLYQMAFWITNTNGLLNQYLWHNASNFKARDSTKQQPVNFNLTLTALDFLAELFDLPEKFTKYVFIEDIIVYFIRSHHSSFVRLYNKSKKYLLNEEFIDRRRNSMKLCKQHLKCLYSIAKNRDENTRQKIYQFQILAFLIQELGLENDYLSQRKKFIGESKKAAKEANLGGHAGDFFDIDEMASPVKEKKENEQLQDEPNVIREQGYIERPNLNDEPVQNFEEELQKKFEDKSFEQLSSDSDIGLPPEIINTKKPSFKLPITGLGLSTVATGENGKTAEQMDDEQTLINQKKAQQKQKIQVEQSDSDSDQGLPPPIITTQNKLGFKLAIGGLGLSTVANTASGLTAEQEADRDILMKNKLKKFASNNSLQDIRSETENDSVQVSSSDDGLPPPIVTSTKPQGLKLALGGLGLSTLAKTDGGKTAEQLADEEMLKQNKLALQNKKDSSESSEEEKEAQKEDLSDSDDGLPPQIIQSKPNLGFKLAIGGLGLSTLAKTEGGKTAEEIADMEMLKNNSKQPPKKEESEKDSEADSQDSSSDAGLPPEIKKVNPLMQMGLPKLAVGGLGISTLAKNDGGKTAEELADMQILNQYKEKKNTVIDDSPSDSDDGLPPPVIQTKPNPLLGLKLNIGGLGLSTLAKTEGGKTAEEMADMSILQQSKIQQKMPKPESSSSNSESDSDEGLPPPIIQTKKPGFSLKIGGLGLSTVKQEGQTMTQEEMADRQQLLESKKPQARKVSETSSSDEDSKNYEGGGKELEEKKQYNTIDQNENTSSLLEQENNQEMEQTQPVYKLNIKSLKNQKPLNKEKLKITKLPHGIVKKRNVLAVRTQQQQETPGGASESNANTHVGVESILFQVNSEQASANFNQSQEDHSSQKNFKQKIKALSQNQGIKKINIPGRNRSNTTYKPQLKIVEESDEKQNKIMEILADSGNIDGNIKQQQKLSRHKTVKLGKKKAVKISKDEFYEKERQKRPLYHDQELHSIILSIVLCLLLQPQRGTLDNLYCHQLPIDNGMKNILYILHQHLSHEENQYIIEDLIEQMNHISPPLAGQRLLKLMCPQLFDLGLYNNGKNWKKLAVGAYGTVYECKTGLVKPTTVAIKQMDLPTDIYSRCVLHDIFTEITCLEEFRLEKCVTDLYDYGVDKTSYYIVMKKYACSLGEWRRKQGNSVEVFRRNLPLYVSIYNQVLKSLRTIHSHNVTHYDIKCDNILIDFPGCENEPDLNNLMEDDFTITFGDFGECRIFSNDKDEFCTRNRGTDSIMSPEMLQLYAHTRKDHDKYDRRKQVGTTRLSDIWSVGCLFFELLTGEFMLYDPDYTQFFVRVVSQKFELISQDNLDKIDNDQYIRDFLRFILIRDQRLRPSIEKVIKRFEHIYGIIVGQPQSPLIEPGQTYNHEAINSNSELIKHLKNTLSLTKSSQSQIQACPQSNNSLAMSKITRIMESIFLVPLGFIQSKQNIGHIIQHGITHVVINQNSLKNKEQLRDQFEILTIAETNCFKVVPEVMDFLRKVTLYRGRLLFIEDQNDNLLKEIILVCLNHIFRTNTYETYNLIKSQNLFFSIQLERLSEISKWTLNQEKIRNYLMSFPQFSCHCGASLIILDRQFNEMQNHQRIVACNCPSKINVSQGIFIDPREIQNQVSSARNHYSTCPLAANPYVGCQEYLEFLQTYYSAGRASKGTHISLHSKSYQNQLLWAFIDPIDMILGPNYQGQTQIAQDSRRSQLSSKRSGGSKNLIPKIPINQIKKAPVPMIQNLSQIQNTDRQSERLSNRGGLQIINPQEKEIASNISKGIDVNSISIISKKKMQMLTEQLAPLFPVEKLQNVKYGLSSSVSLLDNTPEPVGSGRKIDINPINPMISPQSTAGRPQMNLPLQLLAVKTPEWEVKKCKNCHCWTHAYNQQENKMAILLNNRVDSKRLNSQGLLNKKSGENSSTGMNWNNFEFLKHQFWKMEQELIKKCANNNISGAAPSASLRQNPNQGQSMFGHFQNMSNIVRSSVGANSSGIINDSRIEQLLTEPIDFDGVRVPILKNIGIQLPF